MSRLKHSPAGYRRYMQMSRHKVFVFIEGKTNDPYFYGKICQSVCQETGISYEMCRAQELPGNTGGKPGLIKFFEYLRSKLSLLDDFKDKKTISVFFLDKDIDDLLRKKRKSNHIIYTKYYDVESHLFKEGDLAEAISAAASMDSQEVIIEIGDQELWRRRVAQQWKDWIKLCLFARKKDIRCDCNYGSSSKINTPLNGPIDIIAYNNRLSILQSQSGLSTDQFKRAFRHISKIVDNLYNNGDHDLVFKGKWYTTFLEAEARRIAGSRSFNTNALPSRIPSTVALTVDFDKHWADHFKTPLRNVISLL